MMNDENHSPIHAVGRGRKSIVVPIYENFVCDLNSRQLWFIGSMVWKNQL